MHGAFPFCVYNDTTPVVFNLFLKEVENETNRAG